MYRSTLLLSALLLVLPVTATAQKGSLGQACGVEIKQYCAGVKHGGGRVTACVESHFGEFSASCKRALITAGRAAARACKADAKNMCPDMTKPAKIAACFQDHFAELSKPCEDALLPAHIGGK